MPHILIIDDNPAVGKALSVLCSLHDIETSYADTPEVGLDRLEQGGVDLVIQDMNFASDTTSGAEGEALFAQIRAAHPDLPVILLTAWTHLDAAVRLVRSGAADYLGKPWDDERLLACVRNLLELSDANRQLRTRHRGEQQRIGKLRERFDLCGLVFADPATEQVVSLACQVAKSDLPILITGPNGAGKERIAEIIRANSAVANGPFVTLNCGAIPSELIEAELFGADAGAYTGANRAREGKFEAADGGTLFLDEIGNLPLAGQIKLLRVLETGRFERLGANKERQVKVRVISATNADLTAMIAAGGFRQDLYYRLNVIEVALPPLAERPLDIQPLAEHFLPVGKQLGASAAKALAGHDWPGNVRELKNCLQRAALLSSSAQIEAAALGLPAARASSSSSAVDEPDRETIEAALRSAGGVVAQAAAELGLSRQALYRRMEKLGVDRA
ncbi:sigma-54-dependent transcriptional regulator [Pseudomarimonas arenosa]|uniref:Sigma-54-dependent Fis family transcriptional regulator n=1 Tax=Pseudomarimonas arenosa TaxID=2774145 RepID=A0AAW3ZJJ5_9GAMM|nr:sigma-54 dependent transcriptional regulator [Pseudomarimonas arenosa]MBD8525197.1 sigma-54-dependent Fis family transcriptional regulator [Pseudomarimonas arenosa]